jgi:hypothetical protein
VAKTRQCCPPKKYRVKTINNEPTEETEVRINLVKQKMEADITLFRIRLPKYVQKYQECDLKMEDKITEQTTTETKDKLFNLWKSDISRKVAK